MNKIWLTDIEIGNYLRIMAEASDNRVTAMILSSVGMVLSCSNLDNGGRRLELFTCAFPLGVACIKSYGSAEQIAETEEALNTAQINALTSGLFKKVLDRKEDGKGDLNND